MNDYSDIVSLPEEEPASIEFSVDAQSDEIGRISWDGGKFSFTGDADAAAKVFFDYLKPMIEKHWRDMQSINPDVIFEYEIAFNNVALVAGVDGLATLDLQETALQEIVKVYKEAMEDSSPLDYPRCKTCRWYDLPGKFYPDLGVCHNTKKLGDNNHELDGESDNLHFEYFESGDMEPGPDFGCRHHEEKEADGES